MVWQTSPYYSPTGGMASVYGFNNGPYNPAPGSIQQVAYNPSTGQFMQPNPEYNSLTNRTAPQWIPVSGFGRTGQTAYTPPTVDFNNLPSQIPTGVQVYGGGTQATSYQRPTAPTQPQGTGYRPQFDPTFIQQMLAQRFGNNQGSGIPTTTRPAGPPTLTPGVSQTYGGYQGQGGLGALRAIANSASSGGTTNAPV